MLIAAQALLDANPQPTEEQIREAIGGNLCRCTGYQQIVEAVRLPPYASNEASNELLSIHRQAAQGQGASALRHRPRAATSPTSRCRDEAHRPGRVASRERAHRIDPHRCGARRTRACTMCSPARNSAPTPTRS
jgi:xanthine dehydrogenase iron-sulfur cluster and FAD-binding subunit A